MEKYQKEVYDLQLKIHGQIATINSNDMEDLFEERLKSESIIYEEYSDLYTKLSEHYSQEYEDNKEESDNLFVEDVIADMKRLMEIAGNL